MSFLTEIFSYSFAVRALAAGVLVSVCAALLGINMVLKRCSMLGDGLSHVSFGAAAIGLAMGITPLKIAIPVVIVAAFLLLWVSEHGVVRGDAAIAMVSSGALAVGIIVASLTTGLNTDINNYMFGSILAMGKSDVWVSVIVAAVVLTFYVLFYSKIFACTFDEKFASATGVKVKLYNAMISVLTAVTVVVGMRLMGALLISAIMTFPALSAMRVCKRYRAAVICTAVLSAVSFVTGLLLSFAFDMPTGASVVVVNSVVYLAMVIFKKISSRLG